MTDPHEIWRLASWIARQEGGAVRLGWSDGELILRIHNGRIRFAEGVDPEELCRRLSCQPTGCSDLLDEARSLAAKREIAETFAMGAAKELLQKRIKGWLLDPDRELEIVEGEPDQVDGATISISHTLVELVLSDTSGSTAEAILPDLDVLLSRSPRFLDLYAPLRLSEEADLIVSKITGERTAREVAERSEHGAGEVLRLLAALVVVGILEPEPSLTLGGDVDLLPDEDLEEKPRRRIPVSWILGAAAILVVVLAAIAWLVSRPGAEVVGEADASRVGRHWALVVDMGCEPQDLQRVLKKAQQNPKALRPVSVEARGGKPCWQLVWGSFTSRESAERAARDLPGALLESGFEPHPIELTGDEVVPQTTTGG
ncbi:MAG TPA: hypothetical protein VLT81_15795 [Chondromyces sp.]|nr:hypothetical protein [Chondromyces sp.]